MIPFLLDENFNGKILRGLRLRNPNIDVVRVQDTELYGADDPDILEWATQNRRVLLTHDIAAMTKYTNERFANKLTVAGVIFIRDTLPVADVIEDLLTIDEASDVDDWINTVEYLPL